MATSIVPLPVDNVIPRVVDNVNVPVVFSVPPPRVIDAALTLPGTAPSLESVATDTAPPEIVRPPVCKLSPESVSVPLPDLINLPAPALVVPLNSVDELSPPEVRFALSVIDPAPAIEPMVSAFELRSNVAPDATVTAVESDNTPAAPSLSVPASMLVAPECVFAPDSNKMPAPDLLSVVEPEITPWMVPV